jgi:hypothetical protein
MDFRDFGIVDEIMFESVDGGYRVFSVLAIHNRRSAFGKTKQEAFYNYDKLYETNFHNHSDNDAECDLCGRE